MHILALTWDVARPGDLDPRVHGLARAIEAGGNTCDVVTLGTGPTSTRDVDGIDVTWVAEAPPVLPDTPDYDLAHVLAATTRTSAAAERRAQQQAPDVVLAVGWQTAWTATTLRASRGIPIVARLDSTALERAGGADLDDTGRLVAQVEWWLTYEARRVVTATRHAGRDLRRHYRLPASKVDVVPHGADPAGFAEPPVDPRRPTVLVLARPAVVGRLAARVRATVSTDPADRAQASVVVVHDDQRDAVVLDALAAGQAVVVPDDGPLRELVHARRSGVRVARDPAAVADVTVRLLADPRRRQRLGAGARARVRDRHDWTEVAAAHVAVMRRAREEEADLAATAAPPRPLRPLLLRSPLAGVATPANGRHASDREG